MQTDVCVLVALITSQSVVVYRATLCVMVEKFVVKMGMHVLLALMVNSRAVVGVARQYAMVEEHVVRTE